MPIIPKKKNVAMMLPHRILLGRRQTERGASGSSSGMGHFFVERGLSAMVCLCYSNPAWVVGMFFHHALLTVGENSPRYRVTHNALLAIGFSHAPKKLASRHRAIGRTRPSRSARRLARRTPDDNAPSIQPVKA
jgi:hypothetical protein